MEANERDSCIDMLYIEVSKEIPISREAYGNSLYGWNVEPIIIDDKRIGVVINKGYEIHMHIIKEKALIHARRIIRLYLSKKLKQLGHLVTRSFDERDEKFLRRLGFYETGKDGITKLHRLDKLAIS